LSTYIATCIDAFHRHQIKHIGEHNVGRFNGNGARETFPRADSDVELERLYDDVNHLILAEEQKERRRAGSISMEEKEDWETEEGGGRERELERRSGRGGRDKEVERKGRGAFEEEAVHERQKGRRAY